MEETRGKNCFVMAKIYSRWRRRCILGPFSEERFVIRGCNFDGDWSCLWFEGLKGVETDLCFFESRCCAKIRFRFAVDNILSESRLSTFSKPIGEWACSKGSAGCLTEVNFILFDDLFLVFFMGRDLESPATLE